MNEIDDYSDRELIKELMNDRDIDMPDLLRLAYFIQSEIGYIINAPDIESVIDRCKMEVITANFSRKTLDEITQFFES